MSRILVVVVMVVFAVQGAIAVEEPELLWEKKDIFVFSVDIGKDIIVAGTWNSVIAFDFSGNKLWEYEIKSDPNHPPNVRSIAIGDDLIVAGAPNLPDPTIPISVSSVYAFNHSGSLLWVREIDAEVTVLPTKVAIGENIVVAGCLETLKVFDYSGNLLWSNKTVGFDIRSVAVAQNIILVARKGYFSATTGKSYINAYDFSGKELWHSDGCCIMAVNHNVIVLLDGRAYDLNGNLLWKKELRGEAIVIGQNMIVTGYSNDGYIYGYDLSGNLSWKYNLLDTIFRGSTISSIAIGEGLVVVGTYKGILILDISKVTPTFTPISRPIIITPSPTSITPDFTLTIGLLSLIIALALTCKRRCR
jgi:outer membrane protein assembly factor BamB